ncbi:hypothetical protein RBB50_007440 [Rhinocladiella similis]
MSKPIILHLGDAIKYNHDFYNTQFLTRYNVVHNDTSTRGEFIDALKHNRAPGFSLSPETANHRIFRVEYRFGHFSAIFRPHFQTGGEMGQWDDELISLLPPSVRIFASAGAGYNWADTDALARKGIWYANGAGASDDAVSDTALYMILSVFRNFTRQQLAARTADPEIFTATHKMIGTISHNPAGHVLGIVGLGSIPKKLIPKSQAIGMKVHYYDVFRQSPEEEKRLSVTYHETLESLLGVADCVTLHVPLNAHTKRLINADRMACMKDGSRLINTARGEVVDEEALIDALKSGKISAAGFDVHYHEPQVSPVLAKMDNVTLTTHNGGGAIETRINFELNAMKNILAVVGEDGSVVGEPITPVNRPSGI